VAANFEIRNPIGLFDLLIKVDLFFPRSTDFFDECKDRIVGTDLQQQNELSTTRFNQAVTF